MPTSRQADRTSVHDDIHQRAPVYNDKITEAGRWVDEAMGERCIWGSTRWQTYLWGSGQWRAVYQSMATMSSTKLIWGHRIDGDITIVETSQSETYLWPLIFMMAAYWAVFKRNVTFLIWLYCCWLHMGTQCSWCICNGQIKNTPNQGWAGNIILEIESSISKPCTLLYVVEHTAINEREYAMLAVARHMHTISLSPGGDNHEHHTKVRHSNVIVTIDLVRYFCLCCTPPPTGLYILQVIEPVWCVGQTPRLTVKVFSLAGYIIFLKTGVCQWKFWMEGLNHEKKVSTTDQKTDDGSFSMMSLHRYYPNW